MPAHRFEQHNGSYVALSGRIIKPFILKKEEDEKKKRQKTFRCGAKKSHIERYFVMLFNCLFMYKNVRFVQVLLTYIFRECYNKAQS